MTRPVLYPLRPVDTATVRFTAAPRHRRRVTIDHRPLAGVTPEMLLDWFGVAVLLAWGAVAALCALRWFRFT